MHRTILGWPRLEAAATGETSPGRDETFLPGLFFVKCQIALAPDRTRRYRPWPLDEHAARDESRTPRWASVVAGAPCEPLISVASSGMLLVAKSKCSSTGS